MFIELHGTAFQMLQLLRIISSAGFYLFSYEVNGYVPECCEVSFIHESCLARYGIEMFYGRYLS